MDHCVWFEPVVWSSWSSCRVKNLEQIGLPLWPGSVWKDSTWSGKSGGKYKCHIAISSDFLVCVWLIYILMCTILLPLLQDRWYEMTREEKNRTGHLGLNAEWGSVWKSLLEALYKVLQMRPYCTIYPCRGLRWWSWDCDCIVLLRRVVQYIILPLAIVLFYSKSIRTPSSLFSSTELKLITAYEINQKSYQNFDNVCKYSFKNACCQTCSCSLYIWWL